MYGYDWTTKNGIFRLSISGKIEDEIRPVFKQELDYFGFDKYWSYPDTDKPLLWAKNVRWYIVNGEVVAQAQGGGFYTKPKIIITKQDLRLEPIDINVLWKENIETMKALEQKAVLFIRKNFDKFKKLGCKFVCAFSGGKDSLVLLDLISKALSPDEFYVIFGDTGMELSCTYEAIERAKKRYPNLRFYDAVSHLNAETTWTEFGVPAQRLRWCCHVHKSVPMLMKIRELASDEGFKRAVVFDGVCAAESSKRAGYDEVSIGVKNINQINCRPMLKWNTAEVFTYLLCNDLLLNDAYKKGTTRVGCKVCPMSSPWWDHITNNQYADEIAPLLRFVELFAGEAKQSSGRQYVDNGGWKARTSGRYMYNAGSRVSERTEDNKLIFEFTQRKQDWFCVAQILGKYVKICGNEREQLISGKSYKVITEQVNDATTRVTYFPYSEMDRFVISNLRNIANKVAFCIGCKTCIAHCPHEAFRIKDNNQIYIDSENCRHCNNCISAIGGKGCLVAKSLNITQGDTGMGTSGLDKYGRFGFRVSFLEHFFDLKSECFIRKDRLGNRQYDSLKVWLRESGLLSATNKGDKIGRPTELFNKLISVGLEPFMPLTWAIIWTNLAYNSSIVKWYVINERIGCSFEKNDITFMLGDTYSESTRDNAVTALLETFRNSPIGDALKQGISFQSNGTWRYTRRGWEHPDAVAVLYAMYRYAEETGRYAFALSQLDEQRKSGEAKGMDPVVIFGITPEGFKEILKEIAIHYSDYIKVSFQAGLDNVTLIESVKSTDVLDLAKQ